VSVSDYIGNPRDWGQHGRRMTAWLNELVSGVRAVQTQANANSGDITTLNSQVSGLDTVLTARPRGYVAGVMNTSDVTTTGTGTSIGMLLTAGLFAGRRYRLSAHATLQDGTGAAQNMVADLYNGTSTTILARTTVSAGGGGHQNIGIQAFFTVATDGTYSLQYRIRGLTGAVSHRGAGTDRGPASLICEDIGAA
jgi:hypothetical protein